VVDAGLASRHEDPVDRRQVVVTLTAAGADFLDRFRELNARQMRELLEEVDDAGLRHVQGALDALMAAAERLSPITAATGPVAANRKDPA
jgi:MarR family transcriptional regulator, organic hydroperoxide resistance regulator